MENPPITLADCLAREIVLAETDAGGAGAEALEKLDQVIRKLDILARAAVQQVTNSFLEEIWFDLPDGSRLRGRLFTSTSRTVIQAGRHDQNGILIYREGTTVGTGTENNTDTQPQAGPEAGPEAGPASHAAAPGPDQDRPAFAGYLRQQLKAAASRHSSDPDPEKKSKGATRRMDTALREMEYLNAARELHGLQLDIMRGQALDRMVHLATTGEYDTIVPPDTMIRRICDPDFITNQTATLGYAIALARKVPEDG